MSMFEFLRSPKPSTFVARPTHEPAIVVEIPIYRLHLVLVIGWTVEEIVEHGCLSGISPDSFSEEWQGWCRESYNKDALGFCTSFGRKNSDILIWLKNRPARARDCGTLWHELSHAVDRIAAHCDARNAFFTESWVSEPRAYLYEYLAVEITRVLWNRREE
jgi:hypothetical protein